MYLRVLQSSSLDQVGYDPAAEVLLVVFRDGSAYRYSGVPNVVFERLQAAPSKGAYFNLAIRSAFCCQSASHED